jgi:hypothetical protein
VIAAANASGHFLLNQTIEAIVVECPQPTEKEPQNLCLDARYDNQASREAVKEQMQVRKDPKRVRRAALLPVMAYLLLVRLYGKELDPDHGVTIFQLKQRFSEEVWQEQRDRSEARWRKKLDQLRAAA